MKKTTLLLLFSMIFSRAHCETAALNGPIILNIDQAVAMALQKNLDVSMAEKQLDIIQSRYRQQLGMALPDITISGQYTNNMKKPSFFLMGQKIESGDINGFDGVADAEQVVYSGGRVKTGISAAKKMVLAEKDALRGTKNDIIFTARRFFYAIMLASATAAIEKDNLSLSEEHLNTIQERFRQGLDPDLTLRRQEVEVANAKTSYIKASNLFEVSKLSLADLLTLDVERQLVLEGEFMEPKEDLPSYEAVVQAALANRPELMAARKHTSVARDIIKLVAGDNKPQLSAFANYHWTGQSSRFSPTENERDYSLSAGLRLKYSLFTGFDTYETVRQYSFQYEQAKLAEEKTERAVKLEVRRQWLDIAEARERVKAQSAAIGQARLAMEATDKRFKAGQASQLELNDATFALNRVRTLYAEALYDYWVNVAGLERAVGEEMGSVH